jgi:hypothetical protein
VVESLRTSWVFRIKRARSTVPNVIPTIAPTAAAVGSGPHGVRRVQRGPRPRPRARTRARATELPRTRRWYPWIWSWTRRCPRPRAHRSAVRFWAAPCYRTCRARSWVDLLQGPSMPPRRIPDRERGRCITHQLEITFKVTYHRTCQSHGSTTIRLFC